MTVEPVDYVLKFNDDFYYAINRGIKCATSRKNSKPLNVRDYVVAYFPESKKGLLLMITGHYARKLKEINHYDASNEGYGHEGLLKNVLKNIYPTLKDDDYVFIYEFAKQNLHNTDEIVSRFLEEKGMIQND